jgi:hypothetical protein
LCAGAIGVFVLAIYRITSAPTASFWDCSELIACSYTLGIPHPPGTPLFVLLGRLFALLPTAREPAARIGFLTSLFGALSAVLAYLLIVKLARRRSDQVAKWSSDQVADCLSFTGPLDHSTAASLPHIAGICGALALAFAFSIWDNSVETEVYGPVTVVALLVMLWAVNWREHCAQGLGDNRIVPLSIFLVLLSAGIHFTPMLVVFSLIVFWLIVERRALLDLRLLEFFGGFLVILTLDSMADKTLLLRLVTAVVMLGLLVLAVWVMERSQRARSIFWGLLLLVAMLVVAYLAGFDPKTGRDLIVDDIVLFLASPVSALIARWLASPVLMLGLLAVYLGYLVWLKRRQQLDARYVALGLFLLLAAGTVQYFLIVRAQRHPMINECNPSNWDTFISMLKREQYDPMKLYPRKTMFADEYDYLQNRDARLGLLAGYFEQIKLYVRYLLWQWAGPANLDVMAYSQNWSFPLLRFNPLPALVGLLLTGFGIAGIIDRFRRDKRSFVLVGLAFLVASLGLLTYLNLKLSPSDPRHIYYGSDGMHFVEVRERDYFFAFSFVFYAVFIGLGVHAFLNWLKTRTRPSRRGFQGAVSCVLLLSLLPALLNFRAVSRARDWIPAEYGYNLLASCDDGGVLFTNGDNDTFPLWFVQNVPTRVAGYQDGFQKPVKPGRGVIVANLSLVNTDWYVRQMIEWGAPLSFSAAKFDSLPTERFYAMPNSTLLLKDMVIRDMIATSTGMQLRWGKEYYRAVDPRGGFVGVPVYDDEYEQARSQYDSLTLGALESAQAFVQASARFLSWCHENRFSVAEVELRNRLPGYQKLVRREELQREQESFAGWLERGDYGMPSAEFVKYVVANYHGTRPIYFATTVQDEYLRDVTKGDSMYLRMEGLVQRVVNRPGPAAPRQRSLDARKTAKLLDSVYVLTSMSDPRVRKDDNARGMFGNFLMAGIKLAEQYYAESLQFDKARDVMRRTGRLDLDPGQRLPLYEALYRFSYLDGDYSGALVYLDSLRMGISDPPTLQHLVFQRSFLSQLQGDFQNASGLISAVASRVPMKGIVQVFDTIYAGYAHYKGFTEARRVLARWRAYNPKDSVPVWIDRSLDEVEKSRNQATKQPRNQETEEPRGGNAVPRILESSTP